MPPTLQARSSRNRSSTFKAVVKTVAPKTRCAQKRKINGIQPTSKRKNVDDPQPNNTKNRHKKSKISKPYLEITQGKIISPSTGELKFIEEVDKKSADLLTRKIQQPSTNIQEVVLKAALNENSSFMLPKFS